MKPLLAIGASLSALMIACAAQAQTDGDQSALNVQVNLSHEYANVNSSVATVTGNVANTAAAIGNTFSVSGAAGDASSWIGDVNNYQSNTQGVAATLTSQVNTVTGAVADTAAAIGNSATVNVGNLGTVENVQVQSQYDPSATLTQSVSNVTGSVSGTAAAIGNSLTVSADYSHIVGAVTNGQYAAAPENAVATVAISGNNVTTSVDETAAAIGNSATVTGNLTTVTSEQQNFGNVASTLNYDTAINDVSGIQSVAGNVTATAAAIGNSLSIVGSANGAINTSQLNQNGYESASLTGNVATVTGAVAQTAAAIGNSVSINIK